MSARPGRVIATNLQLGLLTEISRGVELLRRMVSWLVPGGWLVLE